MANPLPVTFSASPLTPGKSYTPQQLADAIVSRLSLDSQTELSFFVTGSTAPTSNVGPWLKDGTTWYVWDSTTGAYIPMLAENETLRYVASITAPDQDVYTLWIQLNSVAIVNGAITSPPGTQAIGLAYWNAPTTSWRSVYDSTFIALGTQIDVAVTLYPFRGDGAANVDSVFAGPGPETKEPSFNLTETFDPSGVFGSSTFTAPVGGYFRFEGKIAFECSSGTPTDNQVLFGFKKNGSALPNDLVTLPITNGALDVRNYATSSLLFLNFGDQVELYVAITATGAGTWRIKPDGTFFSGSRVNASL